MNTHLLINDQGEIIGNYAKTHLFDVQAGSLVIRESDFTEAGSTILNSVQTPAGRIGLGIVFFIFIFIFILIFSWISVMIFVLSNSHDY